MSRSKPNLHIDTKRAAYSPDSPDGEVMPLSSERLREAMRGGSARIETGGQVGRGASGAVRRADASVPRGRRVHRKSFVEKKYDEHEDAMHSYLMGYHEQRSRYDTHLPSLLDVDDERGKIRISECHLGALSKHTISTIPVGSGDDDLDRAMRHGFLFGLYKDVVAGVRSLHDAEVVHCDLKPQNIFLDRHGHAFVGDFGHSIMRREYQERLCDLLDLGGGKQRLVVTSTPMYMSPEDLVAYIVSDLPLDKQAPARTHLQSLEPDAQPRGRSVRGRGRRRVGRGESEPSVHAESDVWALGVILMEQLGDAYKEHLLGQGRSYTTPVPYQNAAADKLADVDGWKKEAEDAKSLVYRYYEEGTDHILPANEAELVLFNLAKWMMGPERARPTIDELSAIFSRLAHRFPMVRANVELSAGGEYVLASLTPLSVSPASTLGGGSAGGAEAEAEGPATALSSTRADSVSGSPGGAEVRASRHFHRASSVSDRGPGLFAMSPGGGTDAARSTGNDVASPVPPVSEIRIII